VRSQTPYSITLHPYTTCRVAYKLSLGSVTHQYLGKMSRPSGPYLSNRLRVLSLNSPPQTALFYARLYHSLCPNENEHESLHILALCFMEIEETYSALHAVRDRAEGGCASCAMILARCCQKLGRYTEGQTILQRALKRGPGSICKLKTT
jgi:anaphase-promoting complex subunit 3